MNNHLFISHRRTKYCHLLLVQILTKNLKILCKQCLRVASQSSILTRPSLIRKLRTSKIQRQSECSSKKMRMSSFLWTESTKRSIIQANTKNGQRLQWLKVLFKGLALLKEKIQMLNHHRTKRSMMILSRPKKAIS